MGSELVELVGVVMVGVVEDFDYEWYWECEFCVDMDLFDEIVVVGYDWIV